MRRTAFRHAIVHGIAILFAIPFNATAQIETDPTITPWYLNLDNKTGSSPDGTIHSVVSVLPADVQAISYNDDNVYMESAGIPSHPVGPFLDGNPAIPVDVEWLVRVPRVTPGEDPIHPETGLGAIGMFVNGIAMYNMSDSESWEDEGYWNNNAIVVRADGFDDALGHPSPLNMGPPPPPSATRDAYADYLHTHASSGLGPYHTHTSARSIRIVVDGEYHYHQQSPALREQLGDDGTRHSPILGFAFDGIPVYGPYGYDNTDGTGDIVRIESSYSLRSIAQRTTLPDGTVLAANFHGPSVGEPYPLGYFIEDYAYIEASGHLDEFNGRFAVTPEYPEGVYAYYATIDESGDSAFPYLLGISFYGRPLMDNMTGSVTIPGGVATYGVQDEAEPLRDALASDPNPASGMNYETTLEFLSTLTPGQFAVLDADGDHLLSVDELTKRSLPGTGAAAEVWVNFQNFATNQDGTFANPFDTLIEADAYVSHSGTGTIRILGPDTTNEKPLLDRAVTLKAEGGTIRIGDHTAP